MYTQLPAFFKERYYIFDKYRGCLYVTDATTTTDRTDKLDPYIENPFLLKKRVGQTIDKNQVGLMSKFYAKLLIWFCNHCYFMAYLISHINFSVFDNADIANKAFRLCTKGYKQNTLCLPRAIFIATTSKKFKKHGCMYIGCFFPSRHMHAWVIEEGMNADIYDNIWICYTPVIKMQKK